MSGPEHPNLQDASDFDEDEFEVSSIRAGATSTSRSCWVARFEVNPAVRRHRRQIAVVVASGLLVLALIASAIPGVQGRLLGFLPLSATPTVSISPLEDLFYLLPNPPGVVVTLDGHALTRLPAPGDFQPVQTTPGRHVFAWTSHLFPFVPQRCTVFIPLLPADTCPTLAQSDLPASINPLVGHVIALHDSLATLPSHDWIQLTQAIQSALAVAQSVATVHARAPVSRVSPAVILW